jgi:DNA gyrase subunit A
LNIGTVNPIDINREMRSSYLDYAMSVIVSRALPDARDGLKPVHRRILYAMHDMGIRANTPHRKSARIVGEVLGKYHPHGDSSVYNAMVRMAQDFSMRYMLVDGQGNFGSIDGDNAAAMRYTEARMSRLTSELLQDIDRNTVNFDPNFDDSLLEPIVLPARIPNLLLNGSSGIAVGMSTDIPPHNLRELADAIVYLIDNHERTADITVEDLMQFVKGPDFPTGALIVGQEGIRNAYATGKGRVIMRAVAEIEEAPSRSERSRIVITEIPYQVNKATLIERMAELVNRGVIDAIADLRDSSDRNGIAIVVDLKRNAQPKKVLNQLYKHTALQSTFSVQMLALVNRQPRLLSLKRALQIFIDHRIEVIERRTAFELDKAQKRQHILAGLLKAIDQLDKVIETIRQSPDVEQARLQLMTLFDLSLEQANAILDMQLRRLAALEQQKLEDEYKEVTAHIEYLESLLAERAKVLAIIREETLEVAEKYGDERRSRIVPGSGELNYEDLIEDQDVLISITQRGYVKRTPTVAYRIQGRGGKGLIGMNTRNDDELDHLFSARNLDTILFFTNQGKAYSVKAYEIPEADRTARGTSLMNVLLLNPEERVTAALPVRDFDEAEYLTMVTRRGRIKRTSIKSFENVRSTGLIALGLDDGDELAWVKMTTGDQDVMLASEHGKAIRFSETDARPMGRTAAGVNAIRLAPDDVLAGCDVVPADELSDAADSGDVDADQDEGMGHDLLIITAYGYGKRTPITHFRRQGRYGQGVRAMNLDESRTGRIVSARVVTDEDEVTIITVNGLILRTAVSNISRQGRYSQGVRIMEMKPNDSVASVAVLQGGALSPASLVPEDEVNAEPEQEGDATSKPIPSPNGQHDPPTTAH